MDISDIPQVSLTEDQIRTVARDYVEGHGEINNPDPQEILAHCNHVLHEISPDAPVFPDYESMKRIISVVRRTILVAQLPTDIYKPARDIDEENKRRIARYMRSSHGEDAWLPALMEILTDHYGKDDEISEETVGDILELWEHSEVLVLLPGDDDFQKATLWEDDEPGA